MPLNKGHGIEASYITVHSYDILVINTCPQLCIVLYYYWAGSQLMCPGDKNVPITQIITYIIN